MGMQFDDDESSPIPFVGKIDVEILTDKGAYYGIVMASPMTGDRQSLNRLLEKLAVYFSHIKAQRAGWSETHPKRSRVRLWVAVHPGSAPEVFELLSRCSPWAEENQVEFSVKNVLTKRQQH